MSNQLLGIKGYSIVEKQSGKVYTGELYKTHWNGVSVYTSYNHALSVYNQIFNKKAYKIVEIKK